MRVKSGSLYLVRYTQQWCKWRYNFIQQTKLSLDVDSNCCWCSVCLKELLEMLTFEYWNIGNIEICVSKYWNIGIGDIGPRSRIGNQNANKNIETALVLSTSAFGSNALFKFINFLFLFFYWGFWAHLCSQCSPLNSGSVNSEILFIQTGDYWSLLTPLYLQFIFKANS